MVCFGSNSMSDKQRVAKMPEKMILLSSLKLKSIFKNPLTYNKMYSIKEQRLLQLKNEKWYFIRSTIKITNIGLTDRNIQNSNNGDEGSDDFNNNDGDIDNRAVGDNYNDDEDANNDGGGDEKFGDDGGANDADDDNDGNNGDANDDGGDDDKYDDMIMILIMMLYKNI